MKANKKTQTYTMLDLIWLLPVAVRMANRLLGVIGKGVWV